MKTRSEQPLTRRRFLAASIIAPELLVYAIEGPPVAFAASTALEPTPACSDREVTPPQTPGPFYKPRSPERRSLIESGMTGTRLALEGSVLSTSCKPVPGALVDFWQADATGIYDNSGFRLRGHQYTDVSGRYRLETILPGLYPGRTRHIHVRVQAPNRPVLTTQLYFPGEPANQRDGIFNSRLVVKLHDSAEVKSASFNFVLNIG